MDNIVTNIEEIITIIEKKQYGKLKTIFSDMNPADIAEVLEELSKEQYTVIYRLLPKELAAEVFIDMDSDMQQLLIESFSDKELKDILEELYLDDTVDIIEEMPANVVKRILQNSTPQTRKTINQILKYPKDSAGSIMTTEYVRLKKNMTVAASFELIRRVAIDKETIYTCYVTDTNRKLIGIVTAKTLLISSPDAVIGDIMESNIISVTTLEDKEEVGQMFDKYDFLALPVVDAENRLVGIITIDDAIDVIHEEVEEDFAKMAAITPSEKEYLKTSVFNIWKTRIPWLLILMISATFTGAIISSFENALSAQVALTAFIPMLMDTGGNSGSQASVTIIRGLSLGEIQFSDIWEVVWKEFRVSIMCGVSLALVTFLKMMLVDNYMINGGISVAVALVVCVTLCITVICAKIIGCSLPLAAKKIGLDPAVMASPFITTIVDAISLVVYFRIASLLLNM